MTAERRDDALLDEAAHWMVLLDSGAATVADREAFAAWLARGPGQAAAFRGARQTWSGLAAMRQKEEFSGLLGAPTLRERAVAALRALPGGVRRGTPARAALAFAAMLLVGLLLLPLLQSAPFNRLQIHETGVAEIRDVALSDGSVVTLGARSRMRVDFSPRQRRVALETGEAFFSVARDPARPFLVTAGDAVARVVGTKFDVHQGPQGVRIAVLEGVVEVVRADGDIAAPFVTAPQKHVLGAGEGILAARGARFEKAAAGVVVTPGDWRQGRLVYNGATLIEVVADINRYHAEQVRIADVDLGRLRVTTSFRIDQIDRMLETLAIALPVQVVRRPGGEIVLLAAGEG